MNQPLHVAYTLKNQKAFRQLLDRATAATSSASNASGAGAAGGSSSSGPRSWTISSMLGSAAPVAVDINAKDALGRTVLHRVCSSLEPAGIDYLRMLLNHPLINVNVQDLESRWTPLHRALYVGNLMAAVLLLQRSDVDILLKDYEGHTAFDVYNSTVENTKPGDDDVNFDLFTWGINRNAALGHGDGNDHAYPELVSVPRGKYDDRKTGSAKFYPLQVKGASMSKLHTAVITAEPRGNLRLCGFGSGGRLGGNQNTQYALTPLQHLDAQIIDVSCGQDHTLALTAGNEILSWGLNRFSQLGYVIDTPNPAQRSDEPIQATPKKVLGLLRGKKVVGIAACRMASAAWTSTTVYTWGTNSGQLGYQEQTQITPRAVPTLANAISVALSDSAMACLLETKDVLCFANNVHFKIAFPANVWPSEVKPYRPPQAGPPIVKLASCESTFVALSELGDVFTFTSPTETPGTTGRTKWTLKPQRVWALRKQMSAVVDVAPGADGALILCTESGHVFVRSRTSKPGNTDLRRQQQQQPSNLSAKAFKFQRVAFLQHVVRVCTNSTGAYAALRVDVRPSPIAIVGNTLAEDMAGVRPFVVHPTVRSLLVDDAYELTSLEDKLAALLLEQRQPQLDDEEDEAPVDASIRAFSQLLGVTTAHRHHEQIDLSRAHGADILIRCGIDIPAHRVILQARCAKLADLFSGASLEKGNIRLSVLNGGYVDVRGCHPLSVLVVLHYLYSDDVPAFWDRRVGSMVSDHVVQAGTNFQSLKDEVHGLAQLLQLQPLLDVLVAAAQRTPAPTMAKDMGVLFAAAQSGLLSSKTKRVPTSHDVVIELSDRKVACHSAVLRSRSPLFASFLDDEEWTSRRWQNGVVTVDFKHLSWRPMEFVFRFIYEGQEVGMFDSIDFVNTLDDYLDFVFAVMACATELLLDRLVLVCSSIIIRHVNVMNVCALLADASYFNAAELVNRLQLYMAMNLECLLENRILEDMDMVLIAQLAKAIRVEQAKKLNVSRSNRLVDQAMKNHAEWLELQDIPQPIIRSSKAILAPKQSPRLSPTNPSVSKLLRTPCTPNMSIPESPVYAPKRDDTTSDDIFSMDDDSIPPLSLGSPTPTGILSSAVAKDTPPRSSQAPAWKAPSTPASNFRVDLKTIMAETAQSSPSSRTSALPEIKGKARISGFQPSPSPASSPAPPRDIRKPSWGTPDAQPALPQLPSGPYPALGAGTSRTPPSGSAFPALGALSTLRPPSTPTTPHGVTPRRSSDRVATAAPTTPTRKPSSGQLGPTITPSRVMSAEPSSSKRRNNDAWSTPDIEIAPPAVPSSGGTSFVAIQQQQKEQLDAKGKPKQSLLEIQREEAARQAEAAELQAEIDFIAWWSAEEERLRVQAQSAVSPPVTSNSGGKRPSGGRGGKRSSNNARRKPAPAVDDKQRERSGPSRRPSGTPVPPT